MDPIKYVKDFKKDQQDVLSFFYRKNDSFCLHIKDTNTQQETIKLYTQSMDESIKMDPSKLDLYQWTPLYSMYSSKSQKIYLVTLQKWKIGKETSTMRIEEISEEKNTANVLVRSQEFLKVSIITETNYIYVYGLIYDAQNKIVPHDYFFDDEFSIKDTY